ncbi:MAG: enoyl-CoA hydratase/isomerase family protein [Chloroflexota bacterium]
MPYKHFLFEQKGHLATVTFNRPEKRNPLNAESSGELLDILTSFKDNADVHVVILTGTGAAFCAGADLSIFKGVTDPEERLRRFKAQGKFNARFTAGIYDTLESLEQIFIAAVNGFAVGGGWTIANSCDFRIAAEEAQFWVPEVDLGVPLGAPAASRLTKLVGPSLAKEMIMTCNHYTARQLQAIGLVHQVVPKDQLTTATAALAEKLLSKKWLALAQAKAIVHAAAGLRVAEGTAITPELLLAPKE